MSLSGKKLSLFCPLWSPITVWSRPWRPSSPTSPWSVPLASCTSWLSWRGEWGGSPRPSHNYADTRHFTLADCDLSFCSILPFEAVVCMYRFLGADKCMYPFIAQRKQATNNNEAKNGIWGSFLYGIWKTIYWKTTKISQSDRHQHDWCSLDSKSASTFFFFFNQLFKK